MPKCIFFLEERPERQNFKFNNNYTRYLCFSKHFFSQCLFHLARHAKYYDIIAEKLTDQTAKFARMVMSDVIWNSYLGPVKSKIILDNAISFYVIL